MELVNDLRPLRKLLAKKLTGTTPTPLDIVSAWQRAGHPEEAMSRDKWVSLFRTIPDEYRPETPLTVYRGTNADEYENGNYGMSWTIDLPTAIIFATSRDNVRPVVLTCTVDPNDVLADSQRIAIDAVKNGTRVDAGEPEIIVNPESLTNVRQLPRERWDDRPGIRMSRPTKTIF